MPEANQTLGDRRYARDNRDNEQQQSQVFSELNHSLTELSLAWVKMFTIFSTITADNMERLIAQLDQNKSNRSA